MREFGTKYIWDHTHPFMSKEWVHANFDVDFNTGVVTRHDGYEGCAHKSSKSQTFSGLKVPIDGKKHDVPGPSYRLGILGDLH